VKAVKSEVVVAEITVLKPIELPEGAGDKYTEQITIGGV
jgi:hypothetical protein